MRHNQCPCCDEPLSVEQVAVEYVNGPKDGMREDVNVLLGLEEPPIELGTVFKVFFKKSTKMVTPDKKAVIISEYESEDGLFQLVSS